MRFALQNTDAELRKLLDHLTPRKIQHEEDRKHIEKLFIEAIAAECVQHISKMFNIRGIDLCLEVEPPKQLMELLSNRTVAEIYMLIWRVTANLPTRDIRLLNLTEKPSETLFYICSRIYSYHMEYARSGKEITPFNRSIDYVPSTLIFLITNKILGIGTKYYTEHCFSF